MPRGRRGGRVRSLRTLSGCASPQPRLLPVREHTLPLGHRGLNLGTGPPAHNALSPGGLKIFQPDLEPSLSAKEKRSGWEESKTEKGRPHGLRGKFLCVRYVHVKVSNKQETSILVCVLVFFGRI